MLIQTNNESFGCTAGIEFGAYEWSATSGGIQATSTFNNIGDCGLSSASNDATIIVHWGWLPTLIYSEVSTNTSVDMMDYYTTAGLEGVWVYNENGDTEVLILADSKIIFGLYDTKEGGVSDLEAGTYTFNENANIFYPTLTLDKNSHRGLSGLSQIKMVVNGDILTLTPDVVGAPSIIFNRLAQ